MLVCGCCNSAPRKVVKIGKNIIMGAWSRRWELVTVSSERAHLRRRRRSRWKSQGVRTVAKPAKLGRSFTLTSALSDCAGY